MTDLPLVLTVEEFARLARISRSLAYERVAAGEIPAIRVGRTWRIPRDRALEFLGLLPNHRLPLSDVLTASPNGGPSSRSEAPLSGRRSS
jgi:excisionase family DNA binding protein